jgi:hypothetical protein
VPLTAHTSPHKVSTAHAPIAPHMTNSAVAIPPASTGKVSNSLATSSSGQRCLLLLMHHVISTMITRILEYTDLNKSSASILEISNARHEFRWSLAKRIVHVLRCESRMLGNRKLSLYSCLMKREVCTCSGKEQDPHQSLAAEIYQHLVGTNGCAPLWLAAAP